MMPIENTSVLWTDQEVANHIGMSTSWVRVQRMKRRNNEDHILNIDPILLGSAVRYRRHDIEQWANALPNEGYHNA